MALGTTPHKYSSLNNHKKKMEVIRRYFMRNTFVLHLKLTSTSEYQKSQHKINTLNEVNTSPSK